MPPLSHGMSGTAIYRTWKKIKKRCYHESDKDFHHYGGRGITVCETWRHDFETFFMDMGPRPDGMTLERIDNDGPYAPDNCRWADRADQAKNRRTTRFVHYDGRELCVKDLAKLTSVNYKTFRSRLIAGCTVEEAMQPKGRPRRKGACPICGGKIMGHGYCGKHRYRFLKHGDPHIVAQPFTGKTYTVKD